MQMYVIVGMHVTLFIEVKVKAVFKSKLSTFWHTSESTFYRKYIKFVRTLIFTIQNRLAFFVFQ